ncbi:MAG TPA: hypothetical protein VKP30_22395, partial [Polyangiaceae bacterium]|nr:hypothetical protein [Polyangiaceae bacterium]
AQRPLHRNTLSHFGAPNRAARSDGSTDAGSSVEAGDNGATTSPFNEAVAPNPTESVPVKGKRRTGGTIAVILSAIVLAGVFVAMMVGRSGTEPVLSASTAGAVIPAIEPSAAEPLPVVNEPAPAHSVAAPSASTDESPTTATSSGPVAVGAAPEVTSTAASAPASTPPNIVRVTLDVRPTDAKVIYQGRLQPGPPYEFEVTKGKRMALEVVRFGFATQKVVLDGRKSSVLVGLRRAAGHPAAERR